MQKRELMEKEQDVQRGHVPSGYPFSPVPGIEIQTTMRGDGREASNTDGRGGGGIEVTPEARKMAEVNSCHFMSGILLRQFFLGEFSWAPVSGAW